MAPITSLIELQYTRGPFSKFVDNLNNKLCAGAIDSYDHKMIKLIIVDLPGIKKSEGSKYTVNPPFYELNDLCDSETILAIAINNHYDVSFFLLFLFYNIRCLFCLGSWKMFSMISGFI